jgi:precorrin-6B methylase 2
LLIYTAIWRRYGLARDNNPEKHKLMNFRPLRITWCSCLLFAMSSGVFAQPASPPSVIPSRQGPADTLATNSNAGRYVFREQHSPDGIGKFYMGREIAHVMGHQAADWLERPEREEEERTDLLVKSLGLRPGEIVADIGAGTGYLSRRLAKLVGEQGQVLAVDIQPEMLELISKNMADAKVTNVKPILGTISDPHLPPASVDLVVMVDVYHEFSHPFEMMENICKSLKPGGRVAFVEFRGEDPDVPIKLLHKMTESQVRKEMTVQPLEWSQTLKMLPRQHIIVFRKKAKRA